MAEAGAGAVPAAATIPAALEAWLVRHADSLDDSDRHAIDVVPMLGASDLFRRGVPAKLGGDDGPPSRAIAAIAAVAERSLAAAFVFWGQRVFIEFLAQGESPALRERHLAALLAGEFAGASGLSNAMKHLSGIEALGLRARDGLIEGKVPWITNARRSGFVAAAAVGTPDGGLSVIALAHDRAGLKRSADLDLIGLRGTQTAALELAGLRYDSGDVIAVDARRWLPRVRPSFLGYQCGLSIGLARAALANARLLGREAKVVLDAPTQAATIELDRLERELGAGVDDGRFIEQAAALFKIRIALAGLVRDASQLELLASGGHAYRRDGGYGFARRWREAAFIPIVTPSLTQLEGELLRQRAVR